MKRRSLAVGLVLLLTMFFCAGHVGAAATQQTVTVTPATANVAAGSALSFDVNYSSDDTTTGIGTRIHFNPNVLTYVDATEIYTYGGLQKSVSLQDDTGNEDGDANTTKIVMCSFLDFGGAFPIGPIKLATLNFTAANAGATPLTPTKKTGIAPTFNPTPANVTVTGPQPTISPSPAGPLSYTDAGGDINLTINNSGPAGTALNWTISTDVSAWLSFDKTKGTDGEVVKVTAQPNTNTSARSGKITITDSSASISSVEITVNQDGKTPTTITLNKTNITFTADGGNDSFTISTGAGQTLNWTVTDNSLGWLTITSGAARLTGTATGSNPSTVNVAASAHTGSIARTAVITVTETGSSPANSKTINVTQNAPTPPAIGLNPTSLSFVTAGETKTFEITNTGGGTLNWSVSDNSGGWLTINPPTSGTTVPSTVSVTASANAGAGRSATITVSATGAADKTISVTQSGVSVTKGDADGKGKVGDIYDALYTAELAMKDQYNANADVDCDNDVTMEDARKISRYDVGLETTLDCQ